MKAIPHGGVDGIAGRLYAAALVFAYLRRHGKLGKRGPAMERQIRRWLHLLTATQNTDGSWGWFWWKGLASNPTATAYALSALAYLRHIDIALPRNSSQKAVKYLWKSQQKDGLWPVSHIAFWEGKTKRIRWALSARIFYAIASATGKKEKKSKAFQKLRCVLN